MVALDLAMRFFLLFGLFQRRHLFLGEQDALLGGAGVQGLEPLLEGLQIVAQPDRPDAP